MYWISQFILSFCITSAEVYNLHKLSDKKIEFKNKRLIVSFFILMILALINYSNVNAFIRITIISLALMLFYKFVFKENFRDSIITPLVSQVVIMISEMLFIFLISLLFGFDNQDIINSQFGGLISNISIAIISFILVQIRFFKKLRNFLLIVTDKLKINHLFFFSIIIIVIANILTMILYYRIEFKYLLVFNTFLTLLFLSIIIYSFKNKNRYIKVYDKYNTTLNSLKEYEEILDKYRVSNHENKNQLLTIRNMMPKSNKKVINYIDAIVENKLKDNDKVMFETSKIPAGGLRGLIYSKVLLMKELNIDYELEISNEVKTFNLIESIDDSTMLDICKIIGVYLDNAIDATKNLEEKYINFEMYLEDKILNISISNNYEGYIDIDNIEKKGNTTKGAGHGYGLALSKKIIDENNRLMNQKNISKECFTQILKIKM
jgi:two-component system sensor histidine kinase AgrC